MVRHVHQSKMRGVQVSHRGHERSTILPAQLIAQLFDRVNDLHQ